MHEWWIYQGLRNCSSLIFVYKKPQTIKQDAPENWDEFHVVEYSALEDLRADNQRLREAIQNFLADEDADIHDLTWSEYFMKILSESEASKEREG